MKITEMTDYQMGYEDYKAGFPPISDYDPSNCLLYTSPSPRD